MLSETLAQCVPCELGSLLLTERRALQQFPVHETLTDISIPWRALSSRWLCSRQKTGIQNLAYQISPGLAQ